VITASLPAPAQWRPYLYDLHAAINMADLAASRARFGVMHQIRTAGTANSITSCDSHEVSLVTISGQCQSRGRSWWPPHAAAGAVDQI